MILKVELRNQSHTWRKCSQWLEMHMRTQSNTITISINPRKNNNPNNPNNKKKKKNDVAREIVSYIHLFLSRVNPQHKLRHLH